MSKHCTVVKKENNMRLSKANISKTLPKHIQSFLQELCDPDTPHVCLGTDFAYDPTVFRSTDTVHLLNTTPEQMRNLDTNIVKSFGIWSNTPKDILNLIPEDAAVFIYGGTIGKDKLSLLKAKTIYVSSFTCISTLNNIPADKFISPVGADREASRYCHLFSKSDPLKIMVTANTSPEVLEILSQNPKSFFYIENEVKVEQIIAINPGQIPYHGKIVISLDCPKDVAQALRPRQHLIYIDLDDTLKRGVPKAARRERLPYLRGKDFVVNPDISLKSWNKIHPRLIVLEGKVNPANLPANIPYELPTPDQYGLEHLSMENDEWSQQLIFPRGIWNTDELPGLPRIGIDSEVPTRTLRAVHHNRIPKVFIGHMHRCNREQDLFFRSFAHYVQTLPQRPSLPARSAHVIASSAIEMASSGAQINHRVTPDLSTDTSSSSSRESTPTNSSVSTNVIFPDSSRTPSPIAPLPAQIKGNGGANYKELKQPAHAEAHSLSLSREKSSAHLSSSLFSRQEPSNQDRKRPMPDASLPIKKRREFRVLRCMNI